MAPKIGLFLGNPEGWRKPFLWCMGLWVVFILGRYIALFPNEFLILKDSFSLAPGLGAFSFYSWAETWQRAFKVGVTVLAVGIATIRMGGMFRSLFGFKPENRALQYSIDLALGIFLIDLLWIGFGLNHLWYVVFLRWVFIGLLLICAISVIPQLKGFSAGRVIWPAKSFYLLLAMAGVYVLFSLIHVVLPETHIDGLNYHLGVPVDWLYEHGISNTIDHFTRFPMGGELFLLTGYLFQGPEAAKGLNVLVWMVCALAAGGWARVGGGAEAFWLAFGGVLTLPLFSLIGWTTQIEGTLSFFCLLFFYGLYRMVQDRISGPLVLLAGVMGGMALSTKYIAALEIGVGLFLLLFFLRGMVDLKRYGGILAVVLGVGGVWFLKNWIFDHDPIAPYFDGFFNGGTKDWWANTDDAADLNRHPWTWYRSIWDLVMTHPSLYGFVGPVVLLLLPAGLLLKGADRAWKFVGWNLVVLCPMGLMLFVILKFQLPVIILFLVYVSVLLARQMGETGTRTAALVMGLSAVICFPPLAGMSAHYYSGTGIWSGHEDREGYLTRLLPFYPSRSFVAENLPSDSKLLLLGAPGAYYPMAAQENDGFFQRAVATSKDLEELARKMKQRNFTHIVVNLSDVGSERRFSIFEMAPIQWKRVDDYFRLGLDRVYAKGPVLIFGVRSTLRQKGDKRAVDPFLFFSDPASTFIQCQRKGDLQRASVELQKALALYPFSDYWHVQKQRLDVLLKARAVP